MLSTLKRRVLQGVMTQRFHTEASIRSVWLHRMSKNLDEWFTICQMDADSVSILFDILDERYGKQLKSNNQEAAVWAMDAALQQMLEVIDHKMLRPISSSN